MFNKADSKMAYDAFMKLEKVEGKNNLWRKTKEGRVVYYNSKDSGKYYWSYLDGEII